MKALLFAGLTTLIFLGCAPAQYPRKQVPSSTLIDIKNEWPKAVLGITDALQQPFFRSAPIVPPGTFPNNHGSSIIGLSNGDILITWFAGARETSGDTKIYAVRYSKETETYSAPRVVVEKNETTEGVPGPDASLGNTALFRDDEGVLWLFYNVIPFGGWSLAEVNYKVSFDNAATWSMARRFTTFPGNLIKNRPVQIDRSHILVPLYTELFTHRGYVCKTRIEKGAVLSQNCDGVIPLDDAIQPVIVPLGGNVLLAFLRDTHRRYIRRSWSYDRGTTWVGADVTSLPNPNSAVDAIRLNDGRILLAYNDSTENRTPLSLAVSEDNGITFKKVADLEVGEEGSGYSYPSLIQTPDSLIHITYTYRRKTIVHATFNAAWLLSGNTLARQK